MKSQLSILARETTAPGFSLASVPVRQAANLADAVVVSTELFNDPSIGVVLMDEMFYDHLPEELKHRISRRAFPLVVPVPGPVWEERPESAESYIVELLRQVIGYRVRLR